MYYTEQMLRLLDRITLDFPIPEHKPNESNSIIFTRESTSGIALWLWTSPLSKDKFLLGSEDELLDVEKLIKDVKTLLATDNKTV